MLDGANTSASLRLHATMLEDANTRARNEYLRNGAEHTIVRALTWSSKRLALISH